VICGHKNCQRDAVWRVKSGDPDEGAHFLTSACRRHLDRCVEDAETVTGICPEVTLRSDAPTFWLAQRGTKVALVEARTAQGAARLAARALNLTSCKARRWYQKDGDFVGNTYVPTRKIVDSATCAEGYGYPRAAPYLTDWRGASLRPATAAEVEAWTAARDQQRALRGKSRKAIRVAFA
jgi:hypothetical protein